MKRDIRKVVAISLETARGFGPYIEAELRAQKIVDVAGFRLRLKEGEPEQLALT